MNAINPIKSQLERFIRRYHLVRLIKGSILFVALGIVFFALVVGLEFFLWGSSFFRQLLLWTFISVEGMLFIMLVLPSLLRWMRLSKGISKLDAAKIIGQHFPEIQDRLVNLLELSNLSESSDLLHASIAQRSSELSFFTFEKAARFAPVKKAVYFLGIPAVVFLCIWLFDFGEDFSNSYTRVVSYNVAFTKPSPFDFIVDVPNKVVVADVPVAIRVKTIGNVIPEEVRIVIDGMEQVLQFYGEFYEFTFVPPAGTSTFYFKGGGYSSKEYDLIAAAAPLISSLEVRVSPPKYTKIPSFTAEGVGKLAVPYGSLLSMSVQGKSISAIDFLCSSDTLSFSSTENGFILTEQMFKSRFGEVAAYNDSVMLREIIPLQLNVVNDSYPDLNVTVGVDSSKVLARNVYRAKFSDDYEVAKIQLTYKAVSDTVYSTVILAKPLAAQGSFEYVFPDGLDVQNDTGYEFYFEAIDNDIFSGGKSSKSGLFFSTLLNELDTENAILNQQKQSVAELEKQVQDVRKDEIVLETLIKEGAQSNSVSFSDQQSMNSVFKKQQEQQRALQEVAKRLKEQLQEVNPLDEESNALLKERLERQELEAKKTEKLLEELSKLAQKLDRDELLKRVEKLAIKQGGSQRNLSQLLELTKRYYVAEKAALLSSELARFAEEQGELLKDSLHLEIKMDKQAALNKEVEDVEQQLQEMLKDNQKLLKPMDFPVEIPELLEMKKEMGEALDGLKRKDKSELKHQKKATNLLNRISDKLKSPSGGEGQQIKEDAEMLRGVLENVVLFSKAQEDLMNQFDVDGTNQFNFGYGIRRQQELRDLFSHVDDSLFALSLRQMSLAERVNDQVESIYYNMDRILSVAAEQEITEAVMHQGFVLTGSNDLAALLADLLDAMEESLNNNSGSGDGGEDFQLPDIIKGQSQLGKRVKTKGAVGKGADGKIENDDPGKGSDGVQGDERGLGSSNNDEGNDGRGGSGMDSGEVFDIYQEQQRLRMALQKEMNRLESEADKNLARQIIEAMKDFEEDIIQNGFTGNNDGKLSTINYELLKLGEAKLKQGSRSQRDSKSGVFMGGKKSGFRKLEIRNSNSDIEVLIRQVLPLHPVMKERIKAYFNHGN